MQAYALTDIGKKRQMNQDYVFASVSPVGAFQNLFVLADGMGGHKGGDYASKFLTEAVVGYVSKSEPEAAVRVLESAVDMANAMIYRKSHDGYELYGMGTTVVAATIKDSLLTVANVGDSRLYLIRNGITQVTRDHSLVEELVEMGEITRDSEAYRKKKNIITRAVGIERSVRPDFFDEQLEKGDYVLMCSDGLTNMVSDDEILEIITGNGSVQYKARELIKKANSKGGSDNIAVILIKYTEGGGNNA